MKIPPFFLDDWQCEIMGSHHHNAREKLAAFQLEAINKTLFHATANSRFYKTHLKQVDKIANFNEFNRLPFTLPSHIQADSLSFLAVSQDEISRIVTLETSGTTALAKRIFFTSSDLGTTIDFFARILSHLTHPGETVLILLPGNTPASAGDLLKTALDRIGVKAIVPGLVTDFSDTLEHLHTHTPSLIIGLPVQVLALGELLAQGHHKIGFVRNIILTSDAVSPAIKQRVGQTFGCRVFDHYGMTETGFGGGMDCFAHKGYHLRETDLYVEIIDPDTKKPVPPGSWGEIVITTLGRQGMPLVRYRTGDISRIIDAPCPCTSPFRRMDYVRYRYAHTQLLQSGQRFGMPDLDGLIFKLPGIMDFQVVVHPGKAGSLKMEIQIQTCTKRTITKEKIRKALAPLFQTAIDRGELSLGAVQTRDFKFKDTYTGKRRIQD